MAPQEALKILDSICSQVSLNRDAHVRLQQAISVLTEAIKPKDKKKET